MAGPSSIFFVEDGETSFFNPGISPDNLRIDRPLVLPSPEAAASRMVVPAGTESVVVTPVEAADNEVTLMVARRAVALFSMCGP